MIPVMFWSDDWGNSQLSIEKGTHVWWVNGTWGLCWVEDNGLASMWWNCEIEWVHGSLWCWSLHFLLIGKAECTDRWPLCPQNLMIREVVLRMDSQSEARLINRTCQQLGPKMWDVTGGEPQGLNFGQFAVCRLRGDESPQHRESRVDTVGALCTISFPSVSLVPVFPTLGLSGSLRHLASFLGPWQVLVVRFQSSYDVVSFHISHSLWQLTSETLHCCGSNNLFVLAQVMARKFRNYRHVTES